MTAGRRSPATHQPMDESYLAFLEQCEVATMKRVEKCRVSREERAEAVALARQRMREARWGRAREGKVAL